MDDAEELAVRRHPEGTTLHLAPAEVWHRQRPSGRYEPEAFAAEGFVHCTDGADRLLVPANVHCRGDLRDYVVLEIDIGRLTVPVRYDDDACIYPHIYGPIDTAAVAAVRSARRDPDGTFTGFGGG